MFNPEKLTPTRQTTVTTKIVRHPGEGLDPGFRSAFWIPGSAFPAVTFAGMTERESFVRTLTQYALSVLLLLASLSLAHADDLPERPTDPERKNDAQALVIASDAVRNPNGSFAVDVLLNEYRAGKLNATSSLVVYSRPSTSSGQYRNLVRFAAPARDVGKLMLRNGIDLWFHDPANRASVRISPQQRLLGQASNGDVMTTNLARDFDAEWVGEETLQDGEKRERKTVILRLKALREDVAYPLVEYWVDPVNKQPVKANYYTTQRRLMKSAWFRRFEDTLGAVRPTETVIIDGLNNQWVTIMRNSRYRFQDVPEAWLQRDYLARFTGE